MTLLRGDLKKYISICHENNVWLTNITNRISYIKRVMTFKNWKKKKTTIFYSTLKKVYGVSLFFCAEKDLK